MDTFRASHVHDARFGIACAPFKRGQPAYGVHRGKRATKVTQANKYGADWAVLGSFGGMTAWMRTEGTGHLLGQGAVRTAG
eukprot:3577937-Pleurochrysis_carterae.AAC.1